MAEAKQTLFDEERADESLSMKESERAKNGRTDKASGQPFHPLIELTMTRVREFMREREAVFWVFVFPLLLSFALGIAFRNTAPEKSVVAVEADTAASLSTTAQEIASKLSQSPDIRAVVLTPAEAAQALRSGKVSLVIRARQGEIGDVGQGLDKTKTLTPNHQPPAPVFDYRFDPTRPESRTARLVVDDALQRASGRADVASVREEKVTEPGARYIDFLVPGLIGLNLMGSGMWGLGFAVVTARGRKLLKRFAATPMRRSHYLLSFMLSRLVFLTLEVVAVVFFAWLAFGFKVQGSWLSLALIALLGGLTFSGIGLLVAARPTTIEGVSGLMNFVMLPMWLLSGTFFSSEKFPQIFQPFIKALPLTAMNDSLRAVMNEGAPLSASWLAICVLLAWCVLSFAVALKIFRWQ
ncbi:MAG: ABC transporter permease [Pyrinomonadaceae bacterium]